MYHMLMTIPLRYYVAVSIALGIVNVGIYKLIYTPKLLEVTVLEVGKGSATLVRTPSGKTLLIDTGPNASILRALGLALPEWQRSIDAIVLTSTSAKSTGGLPEVQNRYHTEEIINIGGLHIPYGTSFTFDRNANVIILAPNIFSISYGATYISISSTTPAGTYYFDGKVIMKRK